MVRTRPAASMIIIVSKSPMRGSGSAPRIFLKSYAAAMMKPSMKTNENISNAYSTVSRGFMNLRGIRSDSPIAA